MDIKKINTAVKIKINLIHQERRFNSTHKQTEKMLDNRKALARIKNSMTSEELTEYSKRIV